MKQCLAFGTIIVPLWMLAGFFVDFISSW
jgi:hypothetical protein